MLQFIPLADPGAPTSTGNTVTPIVLTIDQMMTNYGGTRRLANGQL